MKMKIYRDNKGNAGYYSYAAWNYYDNETKHFNATFEGTPGLSTKQISKRDLTQIELNAFTDYLTEYTSQKLLD